MPTIPIKKKPVRPRPSPSSEPGAEYRSYLKSYGYTDPQIDGVFRDIEQSAEDRRTARRKAEGERDRSERERAAIVAEEEDRIARVRAATSRSTDTDDPVPTQRASPESSLGSDVSKRRYVTGSGKRQDLFGVPATAAIRWMAWSGLSVEETLKAVRAKGWDGSEATVKIHHKAGLLGRSDPTCGGRGAVPEFSPSVAEEIFELGGVTAVPKKVLLKKK